MSNGFSLLVNAEQLAAQLPHGHKLRVVDITKPGIYAQVHVPGAVHLDYRRLQSGDVTRPGLLPDALALQALFEALGIAPDTHVVAYDDEGGTRAARLLWLLYMAGHTQLSLLNGGIHAWLAAELPVETEPVTVAPASYPLAAASLRAAIDITQLLARPQNPEWQIWDARSPEEYRGERVSAKHAGHIPGAINYEWRRALQGDDNYCLRPLEDIRRELAELGISGNKPIITHCQTHHRSSFTWLLGQLLGFDIQGYPGSWSEWGNRDDTPIAKA